MQKLVIEEPYRFIPPYRRRHWSELFRRVLPTYLRLSHGIVEVECRGLERLRESVAAGKGVLLAPNHCRLSDPMTMGWIVRETGIHLYTMASWHLFKQDAAFDRLSAWMMRRLGAFSILREGADRVALTTAIDILASAERPLVIFPEGVVSRANDSLGPLMDGVAFIARMAAKKAAREGKTGVVVHPVAIRYVFLDDVGRSVEPFLKELESRLTWRCHDESPLGERVAHLGAALLTLKEIEHCGAAGHGTPHQRRANLIERLLVPVEERLSGKASTASIVTRVKDIRSAVLPKLLDPATTPGDRKELRRHLDDVSLAQSLHFYPETYLTDAPSPERLLETVERLEEDLTGRIRVFGRFKVRLEIGPSIDVPVEREKRTSRNEEDPLLSTISRELGRMLDRSAEEIADGRRRDAEVKVG